MKKLILGLAFTMILASCGKPSKVGLSDSTWNSSFTSRSGSNSSSTSNSETPINFEGNYDLIKMGNKNCGASIQIVKACGGYELTSNYSQPERFCLINKGEVSTTDITSTEVTQKDNEITLVNYLIYNSRHGKKQKNSKTDILMSKSLRLEANGTLIISFDLTKKISRCSYIKR